MPANKNLAQVFDQLNMPGMAERARAGKDLSRAVCSLAWYNGSNERVRGEALLVCNAAEADGYDLERTADEDRANTVKMSYGGAS